MLIYLTYVPILCFNLGGIISYVWDTWLFYYWISDHYIKELLSWNVWRQLFQINQISVWQKCCWLFTKSRAFVGADVNWTLDTGLILHLFYFLFIFIISNNIEVFQEPVSFTRKSTLMKLHPKVMRTIELYIKLYCFSLSNIFLPMVKNTVSTTASIQTLINTDTCKCCRCVTAWKTVARYN